MVDTLGSKMSRRMIFRRQEKFSPKTYIFWFLKSKVFLILYRIENPQSCADFNNCDYSNWKWLVSVWQTINQEVRRYFQFQFSHLWFCIFCLVSIEMHQFWASTPSLRLYYTWTSNKVEKTQMHYYKKERVFQSDSVKARQQKPGSNKDHVKKFSSQSQTPASYFGLNKKNFFLWWISFMRPKTPILLLKIFSKTSKLSKTTYYFSGIKGPIDITLLEENFFLEKFSILLLPTEPWYCKSAKKC